MNPENQCPAWDQFVLPILELAVTEKITRKLASEQIPEMLGLSAEVTEQRLNSGARRVDNRIGWAMTHLTKAGLIKKIKRATYVLTSEGTDFLNKHRDSEFTYHQLETLEGYKEAWQKSSAQKQDRPTND